MKKALFLASVAILIFSTSAFAQAWSVSYFDGTAEVKSAKGWAPLALGDAVAAGASVRVSQSGSLELTRGKARITIIRDGTYDLASLSKASDKSGAGRTSSSISQKLQSLTTEKAATTTTAGGVRGAEQGSGGTVTWVEENDETRTEVASLFAGKKYLDAVKVLDSAMHASPSPADEQEYRYLTAAAWYGAGQSVKSYRALSSVSADPTAHWYAKYVLLKAQVLVDATDFSGALDVLKPFISANPSGEPAQVAWLLSSYCYKGLGDAPAAKTALDTGYQLDPSSETAQLIDQQRKTGE